MDEWPTTLPTLLDETWHRLARATKDRRAAFRFPVLATVSQDGAEGRTVVLRAAERAGPYVEVYTDLRTAKVAELTATPKAGLVFWDARASLQVRLRVHASVLTGSDVCDRWQALPPQSRADYAAIVPPGTPTGGGGTETPTADNFAVIRMAVQQIDALHLGRDRHRRALFIRDDGWQGAWLQP